MVSGLADEISELFDSTSNHAERVDQALQEVREALAAVAPYEVPAGTPCWCCERGPDRGHDDHDEECQRARALMSKLGVRP